MPQAAQAQRVVPFQYATTRGRIQLEDKSFAAVGDQKTIDLQRVGFLSYTIVTLVGSILTGAGATGTWDANYWPYNLLSRLAMRSNAGLEFYNTDGRYNRQVQKYHRISIDPVQNVDPLNSTVGYTNKGARVAWNTFPTGAVAATTTYPIRVNYLIPAVSHPDLRAGLIPLQSNNNNVTIYATLGQATDFLGVGGSLGTSPTISLTMRTRQEFFSVPADPRSRPDMTFYHRIIQDTVPWSNSGDISYAIPVNGIILRVWEMFRNGAVPATQYLTANDPRTAQFNNVQVTYAATQLPEAYDFSTMCYDHRFNYGTDLEDGMFLFDFALGAGSPEQGVSARDVYNTRKLTEFRTKINTTITPAANSAVDIIRQELQPRAS